MSDHSSGPRPSWELAVAVGLICLAPPALAAWIPDLAMAASMVLGSLLGAAAIWRWGWPVPLRIGWGLAVLVTTALVVVGLTLTTVGRDIDVSGVGRVAAAVLLIPGAVGFEAFLRGTLYSAIDSARGSVAAVLGAAAPDVVAVALATGDVRGGLWALVSGLLFGLSRLTTGSALPAILARAIVAIAAAVLLVLQA